MIIARSLRTGVLALALATGLTGCHSIVKVKDRDAVFVEQLASSQQAEGAEWASRFVVADRLEKNEPRRALGEYLAITKDAARAFERTPHDEVLRAAYNFAVGRVVELVEERDYHPWKAPMHVPGPDGNWVFKAKIPETKAHDPSQYRLIPTDRLTVSGDYFYERTLMPGVGAPVVAMVEGDLDLDEFELHRGYAPATAFVSFDGNTATIGFVNPFEHTEVVVSGRTVPIAADLTAPLAYGIAKERPDKLGLARLLRPAVYVDTTRLTRLQPYDPDRIPVLLVHGLKDTPTSWSPMINHLHGIPEIRKRFQFWVFSYPSGYPYPYSASLLRDALDRVNEVYPDHKDIVVIGHSMGGVIVRTLVTDPGEALWRAYFDAAPGDVGLQDRNREVLEGSLLFKSRDDIARVLFLAAPHQGSKLATSWIGRLGARLVKLPNFLDDIRISAMNFVTLNANSMTVETMPNSIDTLSPNNRFVKAINDLPLDPDVPFHSIMGDRGKGDTPNSSDGVVEYWSSHLDGAQSELIVPSDHSVQLSREGIQEVVRILKAHKE